MNKAADSCPTLPGKPVRSTCQEACLVCIYPTGPGMGTRFPLRDIPIILGRGHDCDIQIDEHSVSRRHARIQPGMDGYYAIDLQSTNGTFVNEQASERTKLSDGDYLRIGNCIYRFLAGGNIESEYHEEIYRLTIRDGLTDIHNKRYMLDFLDRELARSARYARPLTFAMIDIDRFKEVNDAFGHLGGDYALRELTTLIRQGIRREELFARYGGEEFAIVLPEATAEKGRIVAERVREMVAAHRFTYEGKPFTLTISIGVAATVGDVTLTPDDLIRQADERLYQAKRDGRNRVVA